jgi:hypothetical protein
MTPPSTDLPRTCECGCGTPTRGQWARGHHTRGAGGFNPARHLAPLPDIPASETDAAGDVGDLDPAEPDTGGFGDWPAGWDDGLNTHGPRGRHAGPPAAEPADDEQPLGPDPQPGPLRDTRLRASGQTKITAAIRRDIDSKVGIMLELPGRVWEARDPLCGAVFVQQLPSTRSALVDLICQSPDLVAWFTGVGGGFMLYLNLLAALQPVAVTVWAHHIAHSIEAPGQQQQAGPQLHDGQAYAA